MSEDQTLNLSDFAKVIDFNSLYQSYTEARKGKRWKYAVCKYEVNVLENLMFVHFMLSAHKYRLSPYNCFIVKEPKERLIMLTASATKSFSTVFAIMSWNRTFRKLSYTTTTQARKAKERTSDLTA